MAVTDLQAFKPLLVSYFVQARFFATSKVASTALLLLLAQTCFPGVGTCAEYCVTNPEELNAAITSAKDNAEADVIKLATGTYAGNFFFASTENASIAFDGGYSSDCSTKDTSAHTVIDASNTSGDALFISSPNVLNNINLSDLTVRSSSKVGIYVVSNGNITLDAVQSTSNATGIILSAPTNTSLASVTVKGSKIWGNSGDGIIVAPKFNTFSLEASDLSNNRGGLLLRGAGSSLDVVNNIISWNRSDDRGGIRLEAQIDDIKIVGNKIHDNDRGYGGGGISTSGSNNLLIENNEIYNNSCGRPNSFGRSGGGISASSENATVTNNLIYGNTAINSAGGGLTVSGTTSVQLVNNVIVKNRSGNEGGGAYISCDGGICDIINNTIADNTSYSKTGGLFLRAYRAGSIYNNILYDNLGAYKSKDFYLDNYTTLVFVMPPVIVRNNDIDSSTTVFPVSLPQFNLQLKPSFINPGANDYRLVYGSPLINSGGTAPRMPLYDNDGRPRVFQDKVDMGAYEWQGEAPPVANFIADVLRGKSPLVVQFTDTSSDFPSKWEWDFNGDGITDSTEQHPLFTFKTTGKQTVKLVVSNAAGRNEKVFSDYIEVGSEYPPYGSVSLDAISGRDNRLYATSGYVTLTNSIYASYGQVSQMRFSNDCLNWSDWEAYAGRKTDWKLTDGDGIKLVCAQYKDNFDNVTPSMSLNLVLDTMTPDTSILSQPNGSSDTGSIDFSSSKDGSTFECSIDGASPQSCSSPFSYTLSPGEHTFQVTSMDNAYRKDPSPASITWTIVTAVPLNLGFGGTGNGSVSGDMSCASGTTCPPKEFNSNSTASLIATPNAASTFGGWSGDCAGTGNCNVLMDFGKSVTAIFIEAPKAKVGAMEFPALQAAYDDAATTHGAEIQLLEGGTSSLTAGKGIAVSIAGGYDAAYSKIRTNTTIQAPLVIRSGTVSVKGVIVR